MVAITKCDSCLNSRMVTSENGLHSICCLSEKKAVACMFGEKDHYVEFPNIKLDKIEPLPTDNAVDDIAKSLQEWMWEAHKKGIKEHIEANTVLIDKHFAKTNRIFVGNLNIPPMICGLEIKLTEELPDGYSFALVEAPETERERIIKNTTSEVASEIFTDIEGIFNRYCKDYKYSIADVLLDIAEAKKKYMEGK